MNTEPKSTLPSECENLRQRFRERLHARFLLKADGDVEKATEMLQAWRERREERKARGGWRKHCTSIHMAPQEGLSPDVLEERANTLVSLGFPHKRRNIRVLVRTNGNVEEAALRLKKKNLKWEGCRRQRSESCTSVEPICIVEKSLEDLNLNGTKETANPMEQQLRDLEKEGFTCERQNKRLLCKTGGDFETVRNFLAAREKLHVAMKNHGGNHYRRSFGKELKGLRQRDTDATPAPALPSNESLLVHVPQEATRVIIDGSNLITRLSLFLRQLPSDRHEALLESFAGRFSERFSIPSVLFFENTDRVKESPFLSVRSVKPHFSQANEVILSSLEGERLPVVVTSDRKVGKEVLERGGSWLKPSQWLKDVGRAVDPLKPLAKRRDVFSFLNEEIAHFNRSQE